MVKTIYNFRAAQRGCKIFASLISLSDLQNISHSEKKAVSYMHRLGTVVLCSCSSSNADCQTTKIRLIPEIRSSRWYATALSMSLCLPTTDHRNRLSSNAVPRFSLVVIPIETPVLSSLWTAKEN